jgi:hypothetical protein
MSEIGKKELALFRCIVLMQGLSEAMDDLKNTPAYRQNVKNKCNQLSEELYSYLNKLNTVFWNEDEEIMMSISRGIDAVTNALATWHPSQLAILESALNQIEEQFNNLKNEQILETTQS